MGGEYGRVTSGGLDIAALQTVTMTNKWGAGGTSRFSFTLALRGFTLVALLSWSELRESEQAEAVAIGIAATAIGWVLSRRPRTMRELLAEPVWPAQSMFDVRETPELPDRLRVECEPRLALCRQRLAESRPPAGTRA